MSKISFITGQYVIASWPTAWTVTPTISHGLLNSPIRQAGPVSERQLNR